jgi:hypothetical protein
MKGKPVRTPLANIPRILLVGASLLFLCGFAGYTEVQYQDSSPKGTYDAKVRVHAGPSEKYSWWSMDVARNGQAFISDYFFSPFYAWTCVDRGKAEWASESVLHFMNLSAQGRLIHVEFQNDTSERLEYAELWVRSVDVRGYPHSPSILFLFDVDKAKALLARPEIFPGAEYFMIRCESQGKIATARFKIPSKRGAPHDVNLDRRRHRILVTLSPTGLAIDGGGFEEVTPPMAEELVPDGVRLHLTEEKRDHRKKKQNE